MKFVPSKQISKIRAPANFVCVKEHHRCIAGWLDTVEAINTWAGMFVYGKYYSGPYLQVLREQFPHNGIGNCGFAEGRQCRANSAGKALGKAARL